MTVKLNISDKKLTIVVPSRQYYFAADSGEELKEWSEIILERKERLLGGGLVPKEDPVCIFFSFLFFSFLFFPSPIP